MALSTLRVALRPALLAQQNVLMKRSLPMSTPALDQMKQFWKKNEDLKRPVSPWITYKWELPMISSLAHRVTGATMTVGLYGISIGLLASQATFPEFVDLLKSAELGPAFWFPFKALMAFPVVYHTINGARHLNWDFRGGYEIDTQMKTGTIIFATATVISILISAGSYMV